MENSTRSRGPIRRERAEKNSIFVCPVCGQRWQYFYQGNQVQKHCEEFLGPGPTFKLPRISCSRHRDPGVSLKECVDRYNAEVDREDRDIRAVVRTSYTMRSLYRAKEEDVYET